MIHSSSNHENALNESISDIKEWFDKLKTIDDKKVISFIETRAKSSWMNDRLKVI